MKKYLIAYSAGVATAPLWFYVFHKPLIEHVIVPIIVPILTEDYMDEPLYKFMMLRNDVKDSQKKTEKP